MAIVKAKPTSPGRRGVIQIKSDLYKGKPLKSLTQSKSKNGGRNNNGRINKVLDENGTESTLYNSIAKHPMIENEEEALSIFKNSLTDKIQGSNIKFTQYIN